jgi:hypothetical protein
LPPSRSKPPLQNSPQTTNQSIVTLPQAPEPPKAKSEKAKKLRCDREYDLCAETDRIWLEDGAFTDFTKEFVYLGSVASYDLTDEPDIKRQISKASQAMGALSNLWKNPFIDLKTKHSFFLAIPINLLLWGCKSWALKESAFKKLDAFLHRSIRQILGIKMSKVREERIRNEQVRKDFFDIPDIRKQIAARQLSFIGKMLRHPSPTHLPRQLITAWVNNKRPRGGVLTTNKKSILKALHLLYSSKSRTHLMEHRTG